MRTLTSACVVAIAAAGLSAPVMAQENNVAGFYVGGGFGQFNLDIDNAGDFGSGIDQIVEDDDTSWKLFAGYRFNPYFSLEAAYINLGDLEERITASGSNGRYKVGIDGWSAMALGTLPLGGWELIGKAGYYFYDSKLSTNLGNPGSGSFIDSSSSGEDFVYGVGLGYTVLERLNLRVEYERFDLPTGDSDALWLSAAWRF
jgi:OmpA-OmpF porin, OOP family